MSLLPGGPWSSFVRAAGVAGVPLLVVGGTQTFTASGSYPVPSGASYARAQAWGPGGTGGTALSGSHSGGAGGGGGYGEEPKLLAAGSTLTVTIAGGSATTITGGPVTVTANAGTAASGQSNGTGGAASGNTIAFPGGDGGNGLVGSNRGGAGGGSSAGPTGAGNNGSAGGIGTGGSGATAPAGGGNGGNGGSPATSGSPGQAPGGGGGGGGDGANRPGGAGAGGQAIVTWYYYITAGAPVAARGRAGIMPAQRSQSSPGAPVYSVLPGSVAPFASPRKAARGRSGARTGKPQSATGVPPVFVPPGPPATFTPPSSAPKVRRARRTGRAQGSRGAPVTPVPVLVVNQWAATFAQPAAFGTTPPALQSTVVALTPAASVGDGSGVPSAGNWLFCVCGWNQSGLPSATAGDADDIHSFWRPGDVTASTWAVSPASGNTRTSIWYTPNLARSANDVYAAPNGAMAGMACTVFEVAGLGPWDTVTGIFTNYAAAVNSLNLALGAPSAQAFLVGAATGDSAAAGQALAPAGWSTLATVTASNGSDHSCDAVLTTAILTTSGSVSVNATANSATDLSGVIIGVLRNAPSPVVASPSGWAGNRVILEMALGSGYETPADEMTWTVLNDSAWSSPAQGYKRFWGWSDSTGVPYALGQLQSSSGATQLDNYDGALSPFNPSSPFYPDVTTGTPIRLRMALGTIAGVTYNRWYVFSRNILAIPERRNKALRNYVEVTTTDIWSVVSGSCPTPYRGEIEQDGPGWWWPCDDQPLAGGVQPVSLRNAAKGSTTPLSIIASPSGVSAGDAYSTGGTNLTATGSSTNTPPLPSVATYQAGAQAGWMYGDPQSSPQSYQTGNPVTSNPGSAAWQQTGLLGSGGANTWFLAANDTYPALSSGVTVKGWFNASFFGSSTGYTDPASNKYNVAGQPYSQITLCTIATSSAPVAILYLDLSGHLILETFNGTTGTNHTIYSGSDLRSASWHSVDIQLTQTTWSVSVNGGLTAQASGTVSSMTSAWTWFTLNGDYGNTHGGSSPSSIQHGGNVAYSHWSIFPGVLPAWRLTAHYAAAITAFGLLPAPQGVSLSKVANRFAGSGYTPDGQLFNGNYGNAPNSYAFAAVAVAKAGAYTSGPSAEAATAGFGTSATGITWGDAVFVSWTSLCPSTLVYTSSAAAAEANASTACGSGDAFSGGYGASASGHGSSHVSGGTGASPPAAASQLGDAVCNRIERILSYGGVSAPNRAIDSSADLAVQAATDVGGQSAGASIQAIVDSDNGFLFVDSGNTLSYRARDHLNSDTVTWYIGMNVIAGMIPYDQTIEFQSDPQRIFDAITVQPFSPDGASLASLTPANATAADAAQQQFGVRPKPVTSYLQDPVSQQAQADWLLSSFGVLRRRASVIAIDAATHPAAWGLWAGLSVADLIQVFDAPMGQPSTTGNYRVSSISRSLSNGANGQPTQARMVVVADPVLTMWT